MHSGCQHNASLPFMIFDILMESPIIVHISTSDKTLFIRGQIIRWHLMVSRLMDLKSFPEHSSCCIWFLQYFRLICWWEIRVNVIRDCVTVNWIISQCGAERVDPHDSFQLVIISVISYLSLEIVKRVRVEVSEIHYIRIILKHIRETQLIQSSDFGR